MLASKLACGCVGGCLSPLSTAAGSPEHRAQRGAHGGTLSTGLVADGYWVASFWYRLSGGSGVWVCLGNGDVGAGLVSGACSAGFCAPSQVAWLSFKCWTTLPELWPHMLGVGGL